MEYRIRIRHQGRSAQNKGLIVGRATYPFHGDEAWTDLTINARDNREAYDLACKCFRPDDKRPLSGKSYLPSAALRPRRLGEKVRLLQPYAALPGCFDGYRSGVVTEVLDPLHVSIGFEGYHTQFVDFHVCELV